MARTRIVIYLKVLGVLLALPLAFCRGFTDEKYSSDWITPPVDLSDKLRQICSIDLAITENVDHWTGTITLYSGVPSYDQFGDSDKKLLPTQTLPVTFRKAKTDEMPNNRFRNKDIRDSFFDSSGDVHLDCLRLVMNSRLPGNNRLLIRNVDGVIQRVLALQSERLQLQANQYPISTLNEMNLQSDVFIHDLNRFSSIQIAGDPKRLTLTEDRNFFQLDDSGNIEAQTCVAFAANKLKLTELELLDPSGLDRRVYRIELTSDERLPTEAESYFLNLHPSLGGWHRLILMKQGKVERIVPLHSHRLRSWLEAKYQVTDPAEQRAFDAISRELPLFSDIEIENEHVVHARLQLPPDNERALDHLVDLSHLKRLEIHGDVAVGAPLERLVNLDHIGFSYGSVRQEVLLHAGRNSNLKSVSFNTVRLDCRGLKHLSGLRQLKGFAYWNSQLENRAENYDESSLRFLSSLPEIEFLKLSGFPLTASSIKQLPVHDRLVDVIFGDSAPVGAVINFLKSNPKVRTMMGSVTWSYEDRSLGLQGTVSDEDLRELMGFEELRKLYLHSELLTDRGLAFLSPLKIKELHLGQNRTVTDSGLSNIAKMESLESLGLSRCEKLTNQAIDELKRLPNLRKINISGTKIDAEVLRKAIPNCIVEQ